MGTPAQALKHRGDNKLYRLQVSVHGYHTKNTLQGSKVERNSRYFHKIHWLTCLCHFIFIQTCQLLSLTILCLFSRPHDKTTNLTVCEENIILKLNVTLLQKRKFIDNALP